MDYHKWASQPINCQRRYYEVFYTSGLRKQHSKLIKFTLGIGNFGNNISTYRCSIPNYKINRLDGWLHSNGITMTNMLPYSCQDASKSNTKNMRRSKEDCLKIVCDQPPPRSNDTTKELFKEKKNCMQQVGGSILYSVQAIVITSLMALSTTAAKQSKACTTHTYLST